MRVRVSMRISNRRATRLVSGTRLGWEMPLVSENAECGKKDTLGATSVNPTGHFDSANTQTNWQLKLNLPAVDAPEAVLTNMIICFHLYLEISQPWLIIPDINYIMHYPCINKKGSPICTFHRAQFLKQCMMLNVHAVIGCHCAVKRDCFNMCLPFPSITRPTSK